MPELYLEKLWTIELTTEELRLVLMSLGSRLRPELVDDARALGNVLTAIRGRALSAMSRDGERLLSVSSSSSETK